MVSRTTILGMKNLYDEMMRMSYHAVRAWRLLRAQISSEHLKKRYLVTVPSDSEGCRLAANRRQHTNAERTLNSIRNTHYGVR